jgi:hypothetical protein
VCRVCGRCSNLISCEEYKPTIGESSQSLFGAGSSTAKKQGIYATGWSGLIPRRGDHGEYWTGYGIGGGGTRDLKRATR